MKMAIYSDIHDNLHNLKLVIKKMKELEVEKAFCLGDFISPPIIKEIIASEIITFAIWGNNDGEKVVITMLAENSDTFHISTKTFAVQEEAGKKVFLSHYPDIARSMAKSGDYDAVFYGHDHTTLFETLENDCILANPGEVAASTTDRCTFMVWDTETNDLQTYNIGEHSNNSK